jgi:AcrR family transcriptional regulator
VGQPASSFLNLTDRSTIVPAHGCTDKAKADSRTALLNAARDLIFTRSFEHVGTAEICARAGVRKGSLYHFFSSKEALVLAMLDELMQHFERDVLVPSLNGPGIHAGADRCLRAVDPRVSKPPCTAIPAICPAARSAT